MTTDSTKAMTLEQAISSVQVRNEMRGKSGEYPNGEGWGHCWREDGYWIPKDAWKVIDAHLAPREVSDEDVLGALTRLYTSGYKAGHHYTVEAGYTDVVYSDSSTYFREELVELLKDSDYEAITAALKEAGK